MDFDLHRHTNDIGNWHDESKLFDSYNITPEIQPRPKNAGIDMPS